MKLASIIFLSFSLSTSSFGQAVNSCDKIISDPDSIATYKNGFKDILNYFSEKIQPLVDSCYKNEDRMISTLKVYLVISSQGQVIIARVIRPDIPISCRTPIEKKFLEMDKWAPAKHKGEKVCSNLKIPINILWK